ncbi:MAG: uroporphyrinogen decarboxylase family protein [Armatimonadota bacterium]
MTTTSMTSKERVLAAARHEKTDRAPILVYATPEIDQILRQHFGAADYHLAFEVDFRGVGPHPIKPNRQPEPGSNLASFDEWGTGYAFIKNSAGGEYLEAVDLILGRLYTMDDVAKHPWPSADDYDYSVIPQQIESVKDYAVCLGNAGIPDIINGVGRGRGMEQVLVDIMTEDEVGVAIIDKRVDFYYEWCKRSLKAGQGKIDILCLGEDIGTQKGPTMSPKVFESFFRPRIEKFIVLAHEYGALAMMHSCGSTRQLQPRLIDMGLDILDAVQPEPVGMDPAEVKAEFGDKLTYCGMISTQQTLPHGTVEECRAEARHRLDLFKESGGYFFAPAHCIQPDTPLENVLAIYEEATGKKFL